jgi:hypothetical protein
VAQIRFTYPPWCETNPCECKCAFLTLRLPFVTTPHFPRLIATQLARLSRSPIQYNVNRLKRTTWRDPWAGPFSSFAVARANRLATIPRRRPIPTSFSRDAERVGRRVAINLGCLFWTRPDGLSVFRLVAEQADPQARGCREDDRGPGREPGHGCS